MTSFNNVKSYFNQDGLVGLKELIPELKYVLPVPILKCNGLNVLPKCMYLNDNDGCKQPNCD